MVNLAESLRTDPHFARLVEHAEAASWQDLTSAPSGPRRVEHRIIDDALVLLDWGKVAPVSRVLLLGVDSPARPSTIEAILKTYADAGIASFSVHLSPIARPPSLPRHLVEHGFQRTHQEAMVARATAGIDPPHAYFNIRTAGPAQADAVKSILVEGGGSSPEWAQVLTSRLSHPEWRYYLVYEGSKPYALGGLRIYGEIGWLPPTWTLEPYRNRGTQAALIAHAIRDAEANGCKWVTTYYPVSRTSGTRNYMRSGFELVYMRPRFVWGTGAV